MENNKSGILVLIGGNEDKSRNMDVLTAITELKRIGNIVVIPTASRYYPRELGKKYVSAFTKLGVENVKIADIRSKKEADRKENIQLVKEADCIFFTGGDQVRLVDILQETKFIKLVQTKFASGMIIAGTSAGAAAASDPMIYDGDEMGFLKGSVNHTRGFGFLANITLDTHFLERGRIPRLAQFLLRGFSEKGIGLAEDTGVIIYPDGKLEVIGNHMVTIIDNSKLQYSDYNETKIDELFTSDGFILSFLAPGTIYDLKEKKVEKIKKLV